VPEDVPAAVLNPKSKTLSQDASCSSTPARPSQAQHFFRVRRDAAFQIGHAIVDRNGWKVSPPMDVDRSGRNIRVIKLRLAAIGEYLENAVAAARFLARHRQ
jgi:hypothetical protein